MSCSVAIPTSPSPAAFTSPSRLPFSCRATTNSPETLTPPFRRSQIGLRTPPSLSLGLGLGLGLGLEESASQSPSVSSSKLTLKRKRALRIEIPVETEGFGGMEERSDGRKEVEEDGSDFAFFSKRGKKRQDLEDRHLVLPNFRGDDHKAAFFGVIDGHGGSKAAEFCSKNMGQLVMEEIEKKMQTESFTEIEEAIKIGYIRTDEEFLKEETATGGACCVTALVQSGNLVISNAGDCRAVLCRAGMAEALTSDHKLSRQDERERVEQQGGFVDCRRGVWRLQGSLAVSRAIGDRYLKPWVTPEPETRTLKIESDFEFLILASDGLWDKVGNQEAVDVARELCTGGNNGHPMMSACKELANLAVTRGSLDDTSVMIIPLQNFY